jgi:ABC-type Na+ transport system ATPase subunit NatA
VKKKQEEHVPRHIELTAVLREILRQRIENRIEDLNKPLDLQSKINRIKTI